MESTVTPVQIQAWPKPNYVNPESLYIAIDVVNAICITGMTLFLASRFWSRVCIVKKRPCADDWVMLCAYIPSLAMQAIHIAQLKFGIGRHIWDVPPSKTEGALKMILITQCLFGPTVALTKISVCLGYHRLFPTTGTKHFIYVLITLLIGYGVSSGIVASLQCIPLRYAWTPRKGGPDVHKRCINTTVFFVWVGSANTALDLVVFLWPIRYLAMLKMPRGTRVALTACFCCGVMICVFALVRVWLIVRFFMATDITWKGAIIDILISIELSLGVICGSLPGIRPLLLRIWPRRPDGSFVGTFKRNNPPKQGESEGSDKTLRESTHGAVLADDLEKGCEESDQEAGVIIREPTRGTATTAQAGRTLSSQARVMSGGNG